MWYGRSNYNCFESGFSSSVLAKFLTTKGVLWTTCGKCSFFLLFGMDKLKKLRIRNGNFTGMHMSQSRDVSELLVLHVLFLICVSKKKVGNLVTSIIVFWISTVFAVLCINHAVHVLDCVINNSLANYSQLVWFYAITTSSHILWKPPGATSLNMQKVWASLSSLV